MEVRERKLATTWPIPDPIITIETILLRDNCESFYAEMEEEEVLFFYNINFSFLNFFSVIDQNFYYS